MKIFLKKTTMLLVIVIFSIVLLIGCSNEETALLPADYWSSTHWESSTPESQNMNSEKINEMFDFIETTGLDIHSVIVLRNDHIITECHFYPHEKDHPHLLNSVTKNLTSALIGIAIEDGYIESVDQKVVDIFPNIDIEDPDKQKENITIKNLLTMATGLSLSDHEYLSNMEDSNQLEYILNSPMPTEPGERFNYNSGASHILSAIIHKTTGKSSLEYAQEKIFDPLDISEVTWRTDGDGINIGGTQLFMKPEDLAKFGYLYLNKGTWNDQQIIPKNWVEESTKMHMPISHNTDYGYQWWLIDNLDGYFGNGFGGQFLYVNPKEDIVVIFTAGTNANQDFRVFTRLVNNYIIKAINADELTEENPEAFSELKQTITNLEKPPEPTSVYLPETALEVSGKTFDFDNDESFTLEFEKENSEAILHWTRSNGDMDQYHIGLDGSYKINSNFSLYDEFSTDLAFKGHWKDDNTFILDYTPLGFSTSHKWTFHFEDTELNLQKVVLSSNRTFFDETAKANE